MHNHEVYYYQIRFTGKSNSIRYYLPPVSKKSCYIIERDDDEKCRHRILIVEGVFDAAAALIQCPDYTPVAVLGSSISDYQISQIREYTDYVSEIKIWMDETSISKKIARRLKSIIDYCPISIIKSYGPDPEEVMKERLNKHLDLQWIKPKENIYENDIQNNSRVESETT
jgi:DNA primase